MEVVLIIFAFVFVLGPIAKAYANRVQRSLPPDAEKSLAEVAQLREEVERLGAEVGRLQEEQSFMVRLLSEGDGDDRMRALNAEREPNG